MLGGVGEQRRTNEERAGTFGSVEFVGANRNQIRFELVNALEGQFSEGLDRIGVEGDALLTAEASNFGHRLDRSGFVVGGHDRDQRSVGSQCGGDGFGRHSAVVIDRQECEGEPLLRLEVFERVEHRVVFHR